MSKQITGFKKEGRRSSKIVVFLDDEPWEALDAETIVREKLATGDRLDAGRMTQILAADEAIRARKAAAGYTARAPKSRRELEHYLRGKRFSARAIESALSTLDASGTLDDERVAERHIQSRRRKRNIGPLRLEAELRSRGVAAKIVDEGVEKALEGANLAGECLELVRKYAARYAPLTDRNQRQKFAAFLMRRGYEGEHVWEAIRRYREESQNENSNVEDEE